MRKRELPPSKRRENLPDWPLRGPKEHWTCEQRLTYVARGFTASLRAKGKTREAVRLQMQKSLQDVMSGDFCCDDHFKKMMIDGVEEDVSTFAGMFAIVFSHHDVNPTTPASREMYPDIIDRAVQAEWDNRSNWNNT